MDQNTTVGNDLQKAIDDITQTTNADPVFSDPVAAPSTIPEGDTGELAAPVGPFPEPVPEPEPTPAAPAINYAATPVPDIIPTTEPAPAPAPAPSIAPETPIAMPSIAPEAPIDNGLNMKQVKTAALRDLVPLLDHLNMSASQKFGIYKNMLEDLHDYTVVEPAYRAAAEIADETERAEALLYVIESIDRM